MGKFEEQWKEVFDDAGAEPSGLVWPAIDRELANAEGAAMKKRVVLYQRIAAASILFALLVGSFGIYHWRENNSRLAQNKPVEKELPGKNQKIIADDTRNADAEAIENKKKPAGLNQTTGNRPANNASAKSGLTIAEEKKSDGTENTPRPLSLPNENKNETIEKTMVKMQNQSVADEATASSQSTDIPGKEKKNHLEIELKDLPEAGLASIPEIHKSPVMAEIFRRLPAIPGIFMNKRRDNIYHENVWASVSAATGSFGTGSNYGGGQSVSSSGSSSASGNWYSFAMLGGVRMARRVVLQSGIQYTNQSTGSDVAVGPATFSPTSVAHKSHTTTAASISSFSAPSNILNTNEFVSVPVQAGYLFVDKRIGLQLNSGVSTDFFVRNTVSDPGSQAQTFSQGAGQNSPYRSVNFSGLMNSEVSCKLGSRYRVSLVPGFRYSFNPILKSTAGGSGNQSMWDLGFRFRYIFR